MLANAAAMNYGFAFRVATYATLRRLAAECFGGATGRLVVDSPHNSIYEEDGRPAPTPWCTGTTPAGPSRRSGCARHHVREHRPGGAAARHAPHVELPRGRRPSAEASLHSACHGAGTVVSQLVDRGLSSTDPLGAQHAAVPVRRRGTDPGSALRRRRGRRGAARARAQRPGHPGRPDATHRSPALAHDGEIP